MAVAPNGDIFVVESRLENGASKQPNRVTVLRDTNQDGIADTRSLWADKLYLPFGIAFHGGYLYVANTGSVVRWPYRDGDLQANETPETVIRDIPERGMRQHWTRNILFSEREKRLFLTIGSKENAAIEEPLRGTIVAYTLDETGKPGGKPQVMASGMRNPVGLALRPGTGRLWAVVNERDYLGDNLVPDFFTEVQEDGFYGWPYYFIGPHHDPRLPERPDMKKKVILPDFLLDAHCAPLGLVFTPDGLSALIARHGSQNRSRKVGYDVVRVRFNAAGRPYGKAETFVTGWLPDPMERPVYGRPAGLAWAKDGSLLIADDWGGRIWRITPPTH
jgi:glucose/arabinose dehydrogenase